MLFLPIKWKHNTYIQFSADESLLFITNRNIKHLGIIGVCACDTRLRQLIYDNTDDIMKNLTVYPLGVNMPYKEMRAKTYSWFIGNVLAGEHNEPKA